MSAPAYYTAYGGAAPPRSGAHHASIAPYGPYDTREGGPVYFAIQNSREWSRFCRDVLRQSNLEEDERFRTNADRVRNRRALDEAIAGVLGELTASEVIARLESAGIANARLGSIGTFRIIRSSVHATAGARSIRHRVRCARCCRRCRWPASNRRWARCRRSASTRTQYSTELGFEPDVIARWRREGAI